MTTQKTTPQIPVLPPIARLMPQTPATERMKRDFSKTLTQLALIRNFVQNGGADCTKNTNNIQNGQIGHSAGREAYGVDAGGRGAGVGAGRGAYGVDAGVSTGGHSAGRGAYGVDAGVSAGGRGAGVSAGVRGAGRGAYGVDAGVSAGGHGAGRGTYGVDAGVSAERGAYGVDAGSEINTPTQFLANMKARGNTAQATTTFTQAQAQARENTAQAESSPCFTRQSIIEAHRAQQAKHAHLHIHSAYRARQYFK